MNQQPATNLKCLIRLLSMIFPIMKQYYLLLVKNLNHHTKVILMEKNSISVCAINCWHKMQHLFSTLLIRTSKTFVGNFSMFLYFEGFL